MRDTGQDIRGLRLIETTAITKQVQRRTHRKRRINKKWAKRYGYIDVVDDDRVVIFCGCIYASPKLAAELIKEERKRWNLTQNR